MALFSGITTNTPKHIQLDAGAFYKGYNPATDTPATASAKLIGATQGGGSFAAVPTIRKIEVDGAKGAVKGLEALDEWTVTLTANIKEMTVDSLKLALAAANSAASSSPSSYTKITGKTELADADYATNITWIGRISGTSSPIIIVISNALATNGLSISFADKAEGTFNVTINGHYSVSDLNTPPFDIYYPTIS